MSATLARLRKRAAELEQKKQFDRALEVYVQILDEGGKDLGDEDVPLFNRVGDMLMRKGSVTEALGYYERAVDMYAERGYLNNAIALCSKILRQSPGRAAVYYKLARISAKKGFKSDARKNFLEYADRMQKLGMADEAFRALKEFASLYPDQDDVRLVLAELLSKENRKGEALEQLQSLYQKLQSEGRAAEARATIDRMRSIDPSVTPREGSESQTAAGDLVFLDLSDAESGRGTNGAPQHASARAPMPTPVPALTGLSITFLPGEDAPRPEGFESTAVQAEPVETAPVARSLTPAGSELVVEPESHTGHTLSDIERIVPLDMMGSEPSTIAEPVQRVMDDLREEAARLAEDEDTSSGNQTPMSGIEFADLELDESRQYQALREHDLSLPGELPETPEEVTVVPGPSPASAAAAEDARAAAEEAAELAADIAAREAQQRPPTPSRPVPPPAAAPNDIPDIVDDPEPLVALPTDLREPPVEEPDDVVPDDFLSMPPSFGASSSDAEEEHAFPPIFGLVESAAAPEQPGPEPEVTAPPEAVDPTPRATISIGSAEAHLRRRLELEPENWELRRQLGEALLDIGDRDGGLYELELAMTGFELQGDMDRSQEVVDEILRVFPASVRHHQKRVEFAVRSRDRGRLTNSYLELADALFRTGAGDKAVAVYGRVLELDAQNERAEFALATLAPEELVRLRGVPARAERWTDELVAIGGGAARPRDESMAEEPAPDEGSEHDRQRATPRVEDQERYVPPATPVETLELPDPDWGEGVPYSVAAVEPSAPEAAGPSAPDAVEPLAPDAIEITAPEAVEPSAPEEVEPSGEEAIEPSGEEAIEPSAPEAIEPSAPDAIESSAPDAVEPSAPDAIEPSAPDAVEPSTPGVAGPTTEEEWGAELTTDDQSPGPIHAETEAIAEELLAATAGPAAEHEDLAFDLAEALQAEEAADEPTLHAPRVPTPHDSPAYGTPSRPEPVFHEVRYTSSESEFIDLGEWLRLSEPVRSTRMQVEDPKPTGDEQADFEEMLRRFKRGVAENVEAEDYEAHYDLGVAYKEMGLVDEAIAEFQKSLRGATHRVRSYEALGQCFVEKQQYPIAAALLRRATEVPGTDDQQLVGVLYLLGFATEHQGHPAEALPYYLRVFAVDIEFRDIAERVAALGNLTT